MSLPRRTRNPHPLLLAVRRRPFLMFGAPFVTLIVLASFGLQGLTQTRYDLHQQRSSTMSKEEELGMDKGRKRLDIREEYFRLNNPSGPSGPSGPSSDDADAVLDATPRLPTLKKKNRGGLSMSPVSQDAYEPVRVPRPEGLPEWGPAPAVEEAPVKGQRKEDRWV